MRKNLKETRQAAGFTQQQMADIKIDFDAADAMQERQRKTILVGGQDVPTYQFIFEQGIRLKQKNKPYRSCGVGGGSGCGIHVALKVEKKG